MDYFLASDCITKAIFVVNWMYQINRMKKKYQVKSVVFFFLNSELLNQFTLKEIVMIKRMVCKLKKGEKNFIKLKE